MKTILHTLDIDAPATRVYEALTTETGLAGWWTTAVRAATDVGGRIEFTFETGFNPVMEITELDPPRRVGWRCVDGAAPWADNTFSFEVVDRDGDASRLRMRHEYAVELDDDSYGIFNFNWGYYLESLRVLCNDGKGKPFSPG